MWRKNCHKQKIITTAPAIILLIALFFVSCDKRKYFEDQYSFDDNNWITKDFIRFTVDIPDTMTPYDLYILTRNSTDYRYSNMYLFLHTILPDSRVAIDTIDLPLATPEGKWLGSGIGKYRDMRILIRKEFRFPMAGKYYIEMEQGMRDEILEGIFSVGFRIEKSNK